MKNNFLLSIYENEKLSGVEKDYLLSIAIEAVKQDEMWTNTKYTTGYFVKAERKTNDANSPTPIHRAVAIDNIGGGASYLVCQSKIRKLQVKLQKKEYLCQSLS